MRTLMLLFVLVLSNCFAFSQVSSGQYYSLYSKIESKDTVGLFSKICSLKKANPSSFYVLLAEGDYRLIQGKLKDALNSYSDAMANVESIDIDTLQALVNYKIGSLHYFNSSYPEALKYFNQASLIYNYNPKNYQQARLYLYMGNIQIDLSTSSQTIKSYRAALGFYKKQNDQTRVASIQNNIALAYIESSDFENAEKYLDSSLAIRKEKDDLIGVGQAYNNYGTMFFKMNEFQKALDFYKLGYENRITGKVGKGGTIESEINIGKSYFKLNDRENAIYWLEQALAEAKQISQINHQKRAAEYLKDLYFQSKNYAKAYELQALYYTINDSLYGMDKKIAVENLVLQNQFESKIRQDSINNFDRIKLETILSVEKEKRNTIFLFVLLGGIIFLSIFVFQLYKSNSNKKKANALILLQKDALGSKQKEIIDSIQYAKRIQESLLPTEKYIERNISRLKEVKKS